MTRAEAPTGIGGPLPVFQVQAVDGDNPTADSVSSSTVLEKGESRLVFAETLPDGGVRFVFLVSSEEFQMEETVDLLAGEWSPLPEDEFQATKESLGSGQDR